MHPRLIGLAGFMMTTAAAWPAAAETPPIACHGAKGGVARAICAAPDLRAMDREISALNDRGMVLLGARDRVKLAQSQFAFFKHRNGCIWASHHSAHPGTAVDECIHADMERRVRVLRAMIDGGSVPGAETARQ